MTVIFSNISQFSFAQSPKVIVVGGGIAGLTAAYRLQNAGMHVDLYEARGRVGGRIFSAKIDGRFAELGAQNIADGGEAPNLNRLIKEFGLECVSCRVYLKHAYFNGTDLIPISEILKDKKIDPERLKETLNTLASKHGNMKQILGELFSPEDPLYKILAVRLAAYEGGPIEKLSPLYIETLFHMLLGGICSVHQGNHEAESYVDLISIEGGNSLLPQKISQTLGSHLHLNMPLIKVSKMLNGRFHLTFQNGQEVETEILILAIPCSVYEKITFENSIISAEKLEAIQNVQYGENAKIMLPFETTPRSTSGLIGDEIVCFFDCIQNILTTYYTGPASFFSPHTLTKAYLQARPMIEKGLENCPSFIPPIYAKDEANLSYEGAVGYSWPNDPYAKGTYSYIASGQEDLLKRTVEAYGETFKELFAPIDQHLYFVGEHASILFDVPGTMEAACESGERIARALIQKQKSK